MGSLVATGGNPDLMPFVSDNVDLSAEWYYQQNSYISLDAYNKNVTNFIVAGATQQTINGVIDPTTGKPGVFTVSIHNVNGPNANVYGAEFAIQHVFDDSGFGVQANATVVGTNKPSPIPQLPIWRSGRLRRGAWFLADSANLVAFYAQGDGFQARVAATSSRMSSLARFAARRRTNSSQFGSEPTFIINGSTTIDFQHQL